MLRSTVYPGITQEIENYFSTEIPELLVAFCPERIAEGKAMEEIKSLPQLVGASSEKAYELSCEVFRNIAPKIIKLNFHEAEISKLFANSYRYLKFAIANEFFKICVENNIDWLNVWQSIRDNYPRASDLPMPGFSAGPCLIKDTQQLKYFSTKGFMLGNSALEINENLPNFIINFLESKYELNNMVVGILGMTFKGDVDDFRSSLSFRLKNILETKSKKVYCSDDLMQKNYFVDMEALIEFSDLIIIATPHSKYKGLKTNKPLVDIWRISDTNSII
jgi:UDP-N-acetyl-D-mannosaminuronic acid dehydrogenase